MAVNDIVMGAAGASEAVTFIEDVFSTWLYTGNGSSQTITNGIDLSGKGGLVWQKNRTSGSTNNILIDTVRGNDNAIFSNSVSSTSSGYSSVVTSLNSNGFSVSNTFNILNVSGQNYASWTFREQPKFFDIVTYTGTGANRTIAHNLGSVPGCIMVKKLSASDNWQVYHRSLANTEYMVLNSTAAKATGATRWNSTTPTSSVFSLGTDATVNASGGTYVAYIYAHDAGGFGLSGADNVISCGSYIANGASPEINLGYEAQWVMVKSSTAIGGWYILDNMRNMGQNGWLGYLDASSTSGEPGFGSTPALTATATGFRDNNVFGTDGRTIIYIAIRRGPMAVPTTGTSVFSPVSATPSGATTVTTNFPVDLAINAPRSVTGNKTFWDRLRGSSTATGQGLFSNLTNAEVSYGSNGIGLQSNTTIVDNFWNSLNGVTTPVVYWNMRRAPGFFDVVCYTGTGSARTVAHNLTVAPEMIIVKSRGTAFTNWIVYHQSLGNTFYQNLNYDFATSGPDADVWASTNPTASVFSIGNFNNTNGDTRTFVAYLFATLANVSKVGSYTGTGATQTINAGLASGARFVMIKRRDSTGNWFVWDTARGMVAGTDPRLALNSTTAETNANWVYTVSTGFQIVTTDASVNANGGTYLYYAIA